MQDDLLKILWVEDDPNVTNAYPLEASLEGLDLVTYPCWDEGLDALIKEFDTWDAIILDAKCKKTKQDTDNAARFLPQALADIGRVCTQRKHQICWYVLSAGSGEESQQINDLIIDERLAWDRDWTERNNKKYYFKGTDRNLLFKRIYSLLSRQSRSRHYQLKSILYRDLFHAIDKCNLSEEVSLYLLDLLSSLHFGDATHSEKDSMWKIRKSVEVIFRSMIDEKGMLPPDFKSSKGKINLTLCSIFLSGGEIYDKKDSTKLLYHPKPLYNYILAQNIEGIIKITGSYLHTENKVSQYKTSEYLSDVSNSPYLIRGMTFQLCDFILWFNHYVSENPDPIANMKKWN